MTYPKLFIMLQVKSCCQHVAVLYGKRNITLSLYRMMKHCFIRKTKTNNMHNYIGNELYSGVFVLNPKSPFRNLATRE
ncbi:hypothetical protein EUGRSUZ_G00697 [Eucalyptus grandis]|uniref:Uncharacterized protein n=2 Tax=Eucalyptus grandis TaxID=71139 RepID=A0ACC3K0M3_EUCGR|nr:hypothetical protein EUGRSUZ_G00697 [Eucalyptus grandis]